MLVLSQFPVATWPFSRAACNYSYLQCSLKSHQIAIHVKSLVSLTYMYIYVFVCVCVFMYVCVYLHVFLFVCVCTISWMRISWQFQLQWVIHFWMDTILNNNIVVLQCYLTRSINNTIMFHIMLYAFIIMWCLFVAGCLTWTHYIK